MRYMSHQAGYPGVSSPLIEESVMDDIAGLAAGRTNVAGRRTAHR
jgi:hypothetical protein